MKKIKLKDLKDQLQLILREQRQTPTGGIKETWKAGPITWGRVIPAGYHRGYSTHDLSSTGQGSLGPLPPPHYNVIVQAGCNLDNVRRLIWYDFLKSHTLEFTNLPQLIGKYYSLQTVEVPHDQH